MGYSTNFKKVVNELCCEVENLYPLNYLNETKGIIRNFWNGKPAEKSIPYVVMDLQNRLGGKYDYNDFEGNEKEVIEQLKGIISHKTYNDNYIPQFSFGIIQALMPSYFGCKQTFSSNNSTVEVVPIIKEEENVYSLKNIGFGKGTLGGAMLEKMQFLHEAVDGRITLSETDMQGPFSAASQMWGIENFLYAVYDEPEAVHALLQKTTDVIIEYLHLMYKITDGNISPCHCMPPVWMDKNKGVCVSEDLLAVVSADVVKEFISPYLSQIGKEFGGVLVHTCGSMNHSVKVLANTPYLIGVNCSTSETHLQNLVNDGGDKICYLNHSGGVTCDGLPVLSPFEQMQLCSKAYSNKFAGMAMITLTNGNLDPVKDGEKLKQLSFIK